MRLETALKLLPEPKGEDGILIREMLKQLDDMVQSLLQVDSQKRDLSRLDQVVGALQSYVSKPEGIKNPREDAKTSGYVYARCGLAYYRLNALEKSLRHFSNAIDVYKPEARLLAPVYWMKGYTYWSFSRERMPASREEAIRYWRDSIHLFREVSRPPSDFPISPIQINNMMEMLQEAMRLGRLPDVSGQAAAPWVPWLGWFIFDEAPAVNFITPDENPAARKKTGSLPGPQPAFEIHQQLYRLQIRQGGYQEINFANGFIVPVKDNSMDGRGIRAGDYVLINPLKPSVKPANDSLVLVSLHDAPGVVRIYREMPDGAAFLSDRDDINDPPRKLIFASNSFRLHGLVVGVFKLLSS